MIPFRLLHELAYEGNVGIQELMEFYQLATDGEKEDLERLFAEADIEGALRLMQQVTGTELVDDND